MHVKPVHSPATQAPPVALSAVHTSFVPVHEPAPLHASLVVHASPSSHGLPSAVAA